MRTAKNHDVRLNEILDFAEALFLEKGYESTTVNDILDNVGISKGAFYYYFKSKEEVMDGVISRIVSGIVLRAAAVAEDSTFSASEKMLRIIMALNVSESGNGEMIQELHKPSNAQMHQKSITQTIGAVAPILATVIEQGIREGIYETPYPLETIEFLLVANQFIFDEGIFRWTPEELQSRTACFIRITERSLGAAEGSFSFLPDSINK
jgi:AcrR family transcriptional regulator